jgi:hypothetical protein
MSVRYFFDDVRALPGMRRPDNQEVTGEIPVDALTDVEEQVEEVTLGGARTSERKGDPS